MQQQSVYESVEYKKSRRAYCMECAFEYFVALLVADAFIAKLLKHLGADDSLCGIISSFISLSFVFQLFSMFTAGRIKNTKKTAVTFHAVSQLLFSCLYFIPFLPFDNATRRVVFIICMLTAYFGNYSVTSVIYKWGNSFVQPGKRATYSAVKEMVSLASGMTVSFIIGVAIDKLDETGDPTYGFLLSSVCMLVFCAADLVCLLLIKNETKTGEEISQRPTLREILQNTLANKNYRQTLVINCCWTGATYTTIGFLGTYKQDELFYTLAQIQLINIIGRAGWFALSKPFGKYSDKHSFVSGIKLGFIIAAAGFAANIFATPSTRWFVIIFTLLYNISCAGTGQNLLNITYCYVDEKYFVQASALKSCISGVFGFVCALGSGALLSAVQGNGNTVIGMTVYGQQLQSAISTLFMVFGIIFIKLTLEKHKVLLK